MTTIDIEKIDKMQKECGMQKNVNFEQRFGDSTRNVCVCSRGSSMHGGEGEEDWEEGE